MLFLIGLGLGDPEDISIKGLNIVKNASKVFLENYTSILSCGIEEIQKFYGREVKLVDREMMEQGCDEILDLAQESDIAVLVVGDPLNATTHSDIILRAMKRHIPYKIIHNASIISAVACCGLQIYNFGEVVSIPFWTDTWRPQSYYDKIVRNMQSGMHTLCLLDIKVKEPNLDLLVKGISKMDPPKFMSTSQAAEQLIEIIDSRKTMLENETPFLTENDMCICLARVGSDDQRIVKTTIAGAKFLDMGSPLHCLVIPSRNLHPIELEMIESFT